MDIKDIKSIVELNQFIHSQDNLWIGFSKNGCINLLNKAMQLMAFANGERITNMMYLAYAKDREGTEEEKRKNFSEWLASMSEVAKPVEEVKGGD